VSVSRASNEHVPFSSVTQALLSRPPLLHDTEAHGLFGHGRPGFVHDLDRDRPGRELGVDHRGDQVGHIARHTIDDGLILLR